MWEKGASGDASPDTRGICLFMMVKKHPMGFKEQPLIKTHLQTQYKISFFETLI